MAALKGDRTINELAGQHGVYPTLIHSWKKHLLQGAEDLFSGGRKETAADHEALQIQLYEQVGRLQMELAWLKKICRPRLTPSGPWSNSSTRS